MNTNVYAESDQPVDVAIIGSGQAGLAVAYYLRRTGLNFVILDAETEPGGAWRHAWESLRLFSPARWSSLPGWIMPGGPDYYPSRDDFLRYMAKYEARYQLPVHRPVRVTAVYDAAEHLTLETDSGPWKARAVVSATGSWGAPYVPKYVGRTAFRGEQLHSAEYSSPLPFAGKRVLVVGGGNSGAQIFADLLDVADVSWVTRREPTLLPDDIDGRVLFERATERYVATTQGRDPSEIGSESLGDVVMVPPVLAARDRGLLRAVRPFDRFTQRGVMWSGGREETVDAVIWCTGFRFALDHLRALNIFSECGRIPLEGTRSIREPRLWLVGYGEWTGFASATIIGVGRSARETAKEIGEANTGWG